MDSVWISFGIRSGYHQHSCLSAVWAFWSLCPHTICLLYCTCSLHSGHPLAAVPGLPKGPEMRIICDSPLLRHQFQLNTNNRLGQECKHPAASCWDWMPFCLYSRAGLENGVTLLCRLQLYPCLPSFSFLTSFSLEWFNKWPSCHDLLENII